MSQQPEGKQKEEVKGPSPAQAEPKPRESKEEVRAG